jgi:hypothetical protein
MKENTKGRENRSKKVMLSFIYSPLYCQYSRSPSTRPDFLTIKIKIRLAAMFLIVDLKIMFNIEFEEGMCMISGYYIYHLL